MSAKDLFHDAVRIALQKEGWLITDDPLFIRFGGMGLYIDLAAEKLIAAEKGDQKIAIEIKSFLSPSAISDFHLAVGQFINYRTVLQIKDPDRTLYLAIPVNTYKEFFALEFTRTVIERNQIYLLVYDVDREVIERWEN